MTMTDVMLARARAGDSDAFRELTDPYRRELHVHCYRILGSFQDAEDILQETLLSAWQALDRFDGRSLRAWLYRIASNRCLNYLRAASRRPKVANVPESRFSFVEATSNEEPWWLEPYPDALMDDVVLGPEARYDARESIALSFVAGLQRLPTQQRTALVLRDVLGFSASEAADILESTPASINSALQRARSRLEHSGAPDGVPFPRSEHEAQVVDRFIEAYEQGDVSQIVALLTEDCRATMPPEPIEIRGPENIGAFLQTLSIWGKQLKLIQTRANGQPAFGYYIHDENSSLLRAGGLLVIALRNDQVSHITRFGNTSLLGRFGLPRTLEYQLPGTPQRQSPHHEGRERHE
ncbi:MAG: sigma-70 family RNA polymerase sigma factor [Acidimicrobiales bacterium]